MKTLSFLGLVVVLMSMNFLAAQNVQITVNSEDISTDEVLSLTVEISDYRGRVASPAFPNIPGFARMGPSTSHRSVNGRRSVGFSYNYRPVETGTFTIPKVSYDLNGKRYSFGPKRVKVKKGSGRQKQTQRQDPFADMFRDPFEDFFRDPFGSGQQQDLQFQETNADYFLSFDLNRDTAYLGEQIIGEVRLFINKRDARKIAVDGLAIVEMQQRIKNSGFWQEVFEFKTIPVEPATVNGKNYLVYTLYRTYLFPLKTGTIEFDDLYLDAKKLYVASNASLRQRFLGQSEKFEPIKIRAPRRRLEVVPLPPTSLPSANMVGQFTMEGGINAKQVNTGEVLELDLNIQGTGNMAMLEDPIVTFPKTFESDLPDTRLSTQATERSYSGKKEFKYTLVPTRNGKFDLGPVRFYYFDPKKDAYDSLVVKNIPVRITGEDLENIKLKQSKKDDFYETVFSDADDGLQRDQRMPWYAFAGPMLLVVGAAVFAIMRRSQKTETREEIEDDPFL